MDVDIHMDDRENEAKVASEKPQEDEPEDDDDGSELVELNP
jgi:hypothetical protein